MAALFGAFGIKLSLLLAQAVNFGIVLIALWYFLYKPLTKMLAERQQLVAKGVEDARRAALELAHAGDKSAEIVGKADQEAEAIVKAARSEGGEVRAKMLSDAEARAAAIAHDAEARAQEEAARVRRESEKDIARLAVLAAQKVINPSSAEATQGTGRKHA
jgi:F-type H+-transporting ATPase subunit b